MPDTLTLERAVEAMARGYRQNRDDVGTYCPCPYVPKQAKLNDGLRAALAALVKEAGLTPETLRPVAEDVEWSTVDAPLADMDRAAALLRVLAEAADAPAA
jgi:hypothetical protein